MKIKVEGTEYNVHATPVWLSPILSRIAAIIHMERATEEDVHKDVEELKALITEVLDATVTPSPRDGHTARLFNAVNALTTEEMRLGALFCQKSQQPTKSGGGPGADDGAEAQPNT